MAFILLWTQKIDYSVSKTITRKSLRRLIIPCQAYQKGEFFEVTTKTLSLRVQEIRTQMQLLQAADPTRRQPIGDRPHRLPGQKLPREVLQVRGKFAANLVAVRKAFLLIDLLGLKGLRHLVELGERRQEGMLPTG